MEAPGNIVAKFTTKGLRNSIKGAILEFRSCFIHRKGLHRARKFHDNKDLKLHIGCGLNIKEGFINIDLYEKADLNLDLREEMPFSKNSCPLIYSEHFLEHLDYPDQAVFFLKECYRVLSPGGIFSIGVPDAEWPVKAYSEEERADFFRHAHERWHPKWCVTKMEHINYHFRLGNEHKFTYDFETLKYILELIGFIQVKRRDFNSDLDSENRRLGTLYAQAVKP